MASGTRLSYRLDSYVDKLFIVIFTLATIVILINLLFLIPLNIQKVFASEFPDKDTSDNLDYISDIFEFGTGVFAGILSVLSLNAYRNLKTKRLLLVSIAFGIFSVNVMISKLEVFGVTIESSILDLVLAILTFAALALFFMAIVRRERLKSKTTTDPSTSRL
ncbi:MAG: hypothetical protein WBZ36_13255 [Candidatus Nitrosopolaris sp.]|jgi:hypothetical protein